MVKDLEPVARAQSGASGPAAVAPSTHASAASNYMQAVTDAIVLSARARQVMDELSEGQTVAEAWLSQFTQPPDLIQEAVAAASQPAVADQSASDAQAAMQSAAKRTLGDLSWLFDAMSPPRVDTSVVAHVLADRMAADAVGINPPLPQIKAQAEQSGAVPALYVENLTVTTSAGQTTASVDRVALTTIDPSLAQSTVTADGKPVVVDVGGEAGKIATEAPPALPDNKTAIAPQAEQRAREALSRALLVIRQGGQALPEGTLRVKLDVLLPL